VAGESSFRLMFAIILVAAFGMSAFFRRRARRTEAIPRSREGGRTLFLRLLFAVPFYLAMVVYVVNPDGMAWSAIPLPAAVRWAGVALGLALVVLPGDVLAASPAPTTIAGSDTRSPGEGPGFVGALGPAFLAVLAIAGLAAGLTIAWVRLTARPTRHPDSTRRR